MKCSGYRRIRNRITFQNLAISTCERDLSKIGCSDIQYKTVSDLLFFCWSQVVSPATL